MPRYAPQSLPMGGSRPQQSQPPTEDIEQQQDTGSNLAVHPAVSLGQHIRRERGMEGVRGYVVALREYLPPQEYQELCRSLGVPTDLQPSTHTKQPQQQAVSESPQPVQNNNNNQMMQMLQMLMALQGGGMGGGGFNPLAQLLGGMSGGMQGGGMGNNMGGMGGGQNGINPLLLAQLLNGMQQK